MSNTRFTDKEPYLVAGENGRKADLDVSMNRTSMFIPNYLDRLLDMVALQQGVPKSTIIRNAILREFDGYIGEFEEGGRMATAQPLEPFRPASPTDVMGDFEGDLGAVKKLYRHYLDNEESFPRRVALSKPRDLTIK